MTETRDLEYEEFRTFPDRGVAQLPPTDAELEFLATGKLPGQDAEPKE